MKKCADCGTVAPDDTMTTCMVCNGLLTEVTATPAAAAGTTAVVPVRSRRESSTFWTMLLILGAIVLTWAVTSGNIRFVRSESGGFTLEFGRAVATEDPSVEGVVWDAPIQNVENAPVQWRVSTRSNIFQCRKDDGSAWEHFQLSDVKDTIARDGRATVCGVIIQK